MDNLFNNILTNASSEITVGSAVITMLTALILGAVTAFTYFKVQEESYQKSMAAALVMLPVILSVIILFIGSNIARAFSLAGTLSIIRFRSAPGDAKDIGFIFFDIAAGLACGVGLYGYGALFVIILCAVIIITEKSGVLEKKDLPKKLKITIPENLNYNDVFKDILEKYTKKYMLTKVRTTDLGSLFEAEYMLVMQNGADEREFLNELRCRNGNLNIILTVAAPVTVK